MPFRHISTPGGYKWALIILGSLTWVATMVKSGLTYDFGIGFWGPNGHDGVWHLALINSLSRGSLEMPIFAGEAIKNYHLGFDLLLASLHRLTTIPTSILYFQVVPPVLALLIGLLSYKFINNWTKSTIAAWWSVFFVYFGGSLGWIFGKGESTFWAQQGFSTLLNPPFALSLVILLLALICLQSNRFFLAVTLFILLPQIKIYAGILALGGLLIASFQDRKLFKVFLPAATVSGLIFFLTSKDSTSLLVFQPGWFLENLFSLDRLNWPKVFSALNTYRVGGVWPKAFPAYLLAFAIFWIGNMGTRLIKEILVIKWLKSHRSLSWVEYFLTSLIVAGGLIPMFFLQSGTPWNTIQFFYYSLFSSSLLAGVSLAEILAQLKSKRRVVLLGVLVISLTLPTTLDSLRHYLPNRPPARISQLEIEALNFLSSQPPGVVLTHPAQPNPYARPPRPLYLYESTAYVAALSGHPTFLEDEVNLNITRYPWEERKKEVLEFFSKPSYPFLKKNQIKYIYLVNSQAQLTTLGLHREFSNQEVTIYSAP